MGEGGTQLKAGNTPSRINGKAKQDRSMGSWLEETAAGECCKERTAPPGSKGTIWMITSSRKESWELMGKKKACIVTILQEGGLRTLSSQILTSL